MNKLISSVMAAGLLAFAGTAQATTISADTSIDNGYVIYLSTDDSVAGTSFGSGENWRTPFVDTISLVDGVTNYLHIFAYDLGGVAGLLGEFTLSDASFEFADGSQSIQTGSSAVRVSDTGWSRYTATTDYGANGVAPWYLQGGLPSSARWVWSDDNFADDQAYFSIAINSVPVVPLPASLPLLAIGVGLFGFAGRRWKNKASS